MSVATIDLSEFRKTGDYAHYIGLATPGFLSLSPSIQLAVITAFNDVTMRGDHFYCVSIGELKIFIEENGERGYTAMLPSER